MLDDLFEIFGNHHNKRRYGHGHDHGHEQEHYHGDSNGGYVNNPENRNVNQYPNNQGYQHQYNHDVFDPKLIIAKVLQNKQLVIVLAIAAIILIIAIVSVIFMLLPLLYKMLGMLEKNGIKGIVDSFLPILNRIWEGKQALSGK